MSKMKTIVVGVILAALGALILGTQPDRSQFAGYAQLIKSVKQPDNGKQAHTLNLSDYRPSFRPQD